MAQPSIKYQQSGHRIGAYPEFYGDNRDQRGFLAWCSLWLADAWRVTRPSGVLVLFVDWRMLPKHTADSMLTLPRPTTRADCGQEARPCPWVGCRHHLLLEVAQSNGTGSATPAGLPRDLRPTSLRMNRPNRGRASLGRRPGLESSAAHLVARRWIDDAAEQLANMMHTCSLDVVDAYPDGLSEGSVALLLGVTEQAINSETKNALRKYKSRLGAAALDHEDA